MQRCCKLYRGGGGTLIVNNSPNLVINGKTAENWRNIYINGIADYVVRDSTLILNGETPDGMEIANVPFEMKVGDEVEIHADVGTVLNYYNPISEVKRLTASTHTFNGAAFFCNPIQAQFEAVDLWTPRIIVNVGANKIKTDRWTPLNMGENYIIAIKKVIWRQNLS